MGPACIEKLQYWQTYYADLGHVEYLLDGKGKFGIIYSIGSSLRGSIIYYIYTELCTFFNKLIYVDI